METQANIMEFLRLMNFLNEVKDDAQTELLASITQANGDRHKGNYNAIFGGVLFNYCLTKGKLADALKIHKKINEFDLDMIEEQMPEDDYEWCRINGKDMKAGEYHRQVCEMVKEQYDRRDFLIKKTVEFMKMDIYKTTLELFNDKYQIMPEKGFDEVYKSFMECPFDMTLSFTKNPFE